MDYRGIVQLLMEWPQLMKYLGLRCIPHYFTACLSAERFLKKGSSFTLWYHSKGGKRTKSFKSTSTSSGRGCHWSFIQTRLSFTLPFVPESAEEDG
jgi:hypothetical protein